MVIFSSTTGDVLPEKNGFNPQFYSESDDKGDARTSANLVRPRTILLGAIIRVPYNVGNTRIWPTRVFPH